MIRGLVLVVAVYAAVIAQEFIPAMPFFAGARVLLLPILVCYALFWMPFPAALAFALYTGLLGDLSMAHIDGGHVEIGLGWSMLYYVLLAVAFHFLRLAAPGQRWETHCLASGAATFFLLAGQYAMVCLRREAFSFDGAVLAKIAGPAVAALLLAPPVYLFLSLIPGGPWPFRGGRVEQ